MRSGPDRPRVHDSRPYLTGRRMCDVREVPGPMGIARDAA